VLRKDGRFARAAAAALVATAAGFVLPATSGASPTPSASVSATSTTTTTSVPGTGPAPSGELPTEPAPPGYPVPKAPPKDAPPPPPLTWLTAAQTTGGAVIGKHGTIEQLSASQAAVTRSERAVKSAEQRLTDIRTHIRRVHATIDDLERRRSALLDIVRARAIRVYVGGSDDIGLIDDLAPAASPTDQARRAIYADAAQSVDNSTLDDVLHQTKLQQKTLDGLGRQEQDARQQVAEANGGLARDKAALDALVNSTNDAIHGGRVFPVDGAFDFVDSWGSFRAAASADGSHNHRATDIMAAGNTPIVAVESGTLNRVGWNRLGGWRLWIKGDSGAWFYYAHMRAYAPGLKDGMHVIAGQYLGRVGNTGDAAGGPTHLHFEAHLTKKDGTPSEADKANPYPLLALLAGAPVPPIPPNETSTTAPPTTSTSTTTPRPKR
jgi:murein DD-endopeptidase MepM/ murein hydrolase activator NlpD